MVIATTLFNLAKKANVILHEGTVCDVLFIGKKQLLLTHGSEETNDEWGKNFPTDQPIELDIATGHFQGKDHSGATILLQARMYRDITEEDL
jgi:hypothetical protein